MGTADRCEMERFAQVLSLAEHLLASFSGLDRERRLAKGLGKAAAQARLSGQSELGRSDRRRNVFPGTKRGKCVGKTKCGKGTKTMVLVDGNGLPMAAEIASASPAEVTLIEPLVEKRVIRRKPQRLIYDRAADSDPLRKRLRRRGIELICPHRRGRRKPATQDGRPLRRYRRRWKVERSISWLKNFRRTVVRYEHYAHLFHGFVQLACLMIVVRRF